MTALPRSADMPYQLVYVSSSRYPQSLETLGAILSQSRSNNERDELTGLLVYHDRIFFQVLEGEKDRVNACYGRILKDTRHNGLSLVLQDEVSQRAFPNWTMGFARPEEFEDQHRVDVLSLIDLRQRGQYGLGSDPAVKALAESVLDGFRDG